MMLNSSQLAEGFLKEGLDRSLLQLGIDSARYDELGVQQRRLALCEAVYSVAQQAASAPDWVTTTATFRYRRLSDFSMDEIQRHQDLQAALTALVCLGEARFARPLVSYLSFPEPRWRLLIEPVLRATARKDLASDYRIPDETVCSGWRRWAARLSPETNLPQLTWSSRFAGTAERVEDPFVSDDALDSLWLVASQAATADAAHFFVPDQATLCRHHLRAPLERGDYQGVIDAVEVLVRDVQWSQMNLDTFVACFRDSISEAGSRKDLLRFWEASLSAGRSASATHVLLFQVLKPVTNERRFARKIAKHCALANRQQEEVVADILLQRSTFAGTVRILDLFSQFESLDGEKRELFARLAPTAEAVVARTLLRALADETYNLCLYAQERREFVRPLQRVVARRRAATTELLAYIAQQLSPQLFPGVSVAPLRDLSLSRLRLSESADWRGEPGTYLKRWVDLLHSWVSAKRFPENDQGGPRAFHDRK